VGTCNVSDTVFAFATPNLTIRHVTTADRVLLAAFCEANPGYDVLLTGQVPDTSEWVEDLLTDLPPVEFGWTATHKLIALLPHDPGTILAVMDISENMLAPGVGHIGLFQVAEARHGTGIAHELYAGLEAWLIERGMDAFRLGVLETNTRGRVFWDRCGFQVSRQREADDGSGQVWIVMMKSILGGSLADWHRRVPRDRPASLC
jgi:GNAT superfamily N-acetyltransferase